MGRRSGRKLTLRLKQQLAVARVKLTGSVRDTPILSEVYRHPCDDYYEDDPRKPEQSGRLMCGCHTDSMDTMWKYVTEDVRCSRCACTWDIEPPGAGSDPFGRPSPSTHPEFWKE